MSDLEVTPVEAPVAMTDAGGSESASSTDVDYSKQSDDDILDGAFGKDEPAERSASKDPVEPATPGEEKPVETAPKPEDAKPEEEPAVDEEEPDSLARLYGKNPEIKAELQKLFDKHPEARNAWFKAGAISDLFPTVAEARELRTLFPTTEMAKQASNGMATLAQMEQTYLDNPAQFAQKLASGNFSNFARLIESSKQVLFRGNPQAYADIIARPAVLDAFANARELANSSSDEYLTAALDIIDDRMGLTKMGAKPKSDGPVDPRIAEFERLRADGAKIRTETTEAFSSAVDQKYWDGLNEAVTAAIGKPEAMTPKALERVRGEILAEITKQISARPDLRPQYEAFKRSGNMSPEHQAAAANFLLTFARQLVGPTTRKSLNEWTREVVGQNKAEVARVTAKPKLKDVGAGSGSARGQNSVPGKIDYKKVSDDDILSGAFAR